MSRSLTRCLVLGSHNTEIQTACRSRSARKGAHRSHLRPAVPVPAVTCSQCDSDSSEWPLNEFLRPAILRRWAGDRIPSAPYSLGSCRPADCRSATWERSSDPRLAPQLQSDMGGRVVGWASAAVRPPTTCPPLQPSTKPPRPGPSRTAKERSGDAVESASRKSNPLDDTEFYLSYESYPI